MPGAYGASWRAHPAYNMCFLCAMAAAWGMYALIYLAGIPRASQQANVLVFAIAGLCFIFIFVLPRYGLKPTVVHYAVMAVTLIPSLANGQELVRQSGFLD
jgi:hypothetical protein